MGKPKIRCAIYTRKSSDEGLDQNFNSLDAQQEACAAYIDSQRHEGWVNGKTRYHDGGVSGGTLKRPALERLMTDIDAGLIQMVVVYKIDRLTRSLTDFAKLVERFDAASCSFVSVTQAFNTASSMGRLTLNVLLSFAQFEREVTAERIRDKIAASKKKGLWMGGMPPLGYDPHPDPNRRSLVINTEEAETVRKVFDYYDALGCLNAVMRKAHEMGLCSKRHCLKSGRVQGGNPFSRGQIYAVLRNPIYIGKIRHKTLVWDGQHEPILDEVIWDRVQEKLKAASGRSRGRTKLTQSGNRRHSSPLTGKLRDETGDRLTPTHTQRRGRHIRYYVSNRLISGGTDPLGWRLPASALEQAIANAIARHVSKLAPNHRLFRRLDLNLSDAIQTKAQQLAKRLSEGDQEVLHLILEEGHIGKRHILLELNATAFTEALGVALDELDHSVLRFETPFEIRRRGVERKLVVGALEPLPDRTLIRALCKAHVWIAELRSGKLLNEIAATTTHTGSYIRTRSQLAFLSPMIQCSILEGRQPRELTVERIVRNPMPLEWRAQARF